METTRAPGPTEGLGIWAQGLVKRYGDRLAVDGLCLDAPRGSVLALLGPNGAGKTTTVGMLSCLLRMDGGEAVVGGFDLRQDWKEAKRVCGVSPQESAVAERLSVRENLELIAGTYGMGAKERRRRAEELAEGLGLSDRLASRVHTLSGGLKRRLSIAMALVSGPELLFLDEPSLGLDPQARRSLWTYIESLKGSATIVLTTHYLAEAEALADGIVIMRDGRAIASGSVAEIRAAAFGASGDHRSSLDDAYLALMEREEEA